MILAIVGISAPLMPFLKTPENRMEVGGLLAIVVFLIIILGIAYAQEAARSSYSPVVIKEPFQDTKKRMEGEKEAVMKRHMDLLNERYDLSNGPAEGVMMSGGRKPVQQGVRVKLPQNVTWTGLAGMKPDEIREKDLWPKGFLPLPHPNHPEGGKSRKHGILLDSTWIMTFPTISCPNFPRPST